MHCLKGSEFLCLLMCINIFINRNCKYGCPISVFSFTLTYTLTLISQKQGVMDFDVSFT